MNKCKINKYGDFVRANPYNKNGNNTPFMFTFENISLKDFKNYN